MEFRFESYTTKSTDPEQIIPEGALSLLPFSLEPVASWSEKTDLYTYIFNLLKGTGYEKNTEYNFDGASRQADSFCHFFEESANNATPAPGSRTQAPTIPSFEALPLFGRAMKAYIAWQETIGNVLSEGSYSSIAHILETRTDINCSVQLAGSMYYRQSLQVLRGFIESVILPIHLCRKPSEFQRWKSNAYKTPTIGGEKGIAAILVKDGVITQRLGDKISNTYKLLNGYIHGNEEFLNNTGLGRGEWEGHIFQQSRFEIWAEVFSSLVEVSLALLKINLIQWAHAKAGKDLFCSICHGTEVQAIQNLEEPVIVQYKCKECTHTFWQDDKGEGVVITSIEVGGDAE